MRHHDCTTVCHHQTWIDTRAAKKQGSLLGGICYRVVTKANVHLTLLFETVIFNTRMYSQCVTTMLLAVLGVNLQVGHSLTSMTSAESNKAGSLNNKKLSTPRCSRMKCQHHGDIASLLCNCTGEYPCCV